MFGTKDQTRSVAERGHEYVTGRAWPTRVQHPAPTESRSTRGEGALGRLGSLLSRHPILFAVGAIGLGCLFILSRERQG